MALPPRLIPFPWADFFTVVDTNLPYPQRYEAANIAARNPDNRGSNLVVNLEGGFFRNFNPGLPNVGNTYGPNVDWPTRTWTIPYQQTEYDWELSVWGVSVNLKNVPELNAANSSNLQWTYNWQTGTITGQENMFTGQQTFEGCFTLSYGWDYTEAVWINRPILREHWFEENPNRPNPLWGFTGYTVFGDQGNTQLYGNGYAGSPADIWRRRAVFGVLKRTANPATCGPEDVMLGMIVTSDGVTSTLHACVNGAVIATRSWATVYGTRTYPQASFDAGGESFFESAWDGPPSAMSGWAGFVYNLDIGYVKSNGTEGNLRLSQFPPGGANLTNPDYYQCGSYDTYDVKFTIYIDDTSATHPVDTEFAQPNNNKFIYWGTGLSMSALHGPLPPPPVYDFWTQAVDATESGGSVAPYVPPGQFLVNALALNPVLHIDFEDFTPVPGTGGYLELTPPIQLLDLHEPPSYYYQETTTTSYDSPVGKGMADLTGWWAGASIWPSRAQLASLVASGFTQVSVSNPWSDPLAAAGYTDVYFHLRLNSSYVTPNTGLQLYAIICDVYNGTSENANEGAISASVDWVDSTGGAFTWAQDVANAPLAPLPFFDGEHHVYVFTCDPLSTSSFRIKLYVDGAEVFTADLSAPAPLVVDTEVSIADIDVNTGSGSCAEFLLYDRVLTPAEIATLTL